jgi:hypothetical protein
MGKIFTKNRRCSSVKKNGTNVERTSRREYLLHAVPRFEYDGREQKDEEKILIESENGTESRCCDDIACDTANDA